MRSFERLMKYAIYNTVSDDSSMSFPSTESQLSFGKLLVSEMLSIGIQDASIDENGYVTGTIPSTIPNFNGYTIGFIAHMDLADDAPSENIKPRLIENYDGGDILLNPEQNIVMRTSDFPHLLNYIGGNLIVTDGTTLLGADDKAGIANILTMAETLINDLTIPHGTIKIGFTPDEEIGRGADKFDVEKFGADGAYTVDGGAFGEVVYETFNAVSAYVLIKGVSIHTGDAKGRMVHAASIATEFDQALPQAERPQYTENYEGFYHLERISGCNESANSHYILRDHDWDLLQARIKTLELTAELLNHKYGANTVEVSFKESYRNMAEEVKKHLHLVRIAEQAIRNVGGTPISPPVRGGTDGSRLSFMGLPCPNLGTGGHNGHSRMEYASVESMDKIVASLVEIARLYGDKQIL